MSADGVIEHLDVAKNCAARFLPCRIGVFANALTLEQLEETLRHGVVVAIASPAHAGLQVVACEEALPFMAAELAALIGMRNDRIAGPSPPDSHVQGIKSQLGVNAAARGPANYWPGIQVDQRSQVQPALVRSDIRDVGDPGGIGFTDFQLLLQQVRRNYGCSTAPWTWPLAIASSCLQSFMTQ